MNFFAKKLSLPSLIHLCLHQVSSRKIWKSSDFFRLFLIFLSESLYFSRIVPNKYLSKKAVSGAFFSDFFRFFFREACNLPGSLRTSIFPKIPQMVRIFLIFFEKSFLLPRFPYKYLSKNRGSRAAFLNFFQFSFQQQGYVEKASRKNEEKHHLVV